MFIGEYPAISNGSVLYIIQHDGHFRVTVQVIKQKNSEELKAINVQKRSEYSYKTTKFYVNTSEADMESAINRIQKCSLPKEVQVYDQYGKCKYYHISTFRPQHGYYIEPNDTIKISDHSRW